MNKFKVGLLALSLSLLPVFSSQSTLDEKLFEVTIETIKNCEHLGFVIANFKLAMKHADESQKTLLKKTFEGRSDFSEIDPFEISEFYPTEDSTQKVGELQLSSEELQKLEEAKSELAQAPKEVPSKCEELIQNAKTISASSYWFNKLINTSVKTTSGKTKELERPLVESLEGTLLARVKKLVKDTPSIKAIRTEHDNQIPYSPLGSLLIIKIIVLEIERLVDLAIIDINGATTLTDVDKLLQKAHRFITQLKETENKGLYQSKELEEIRDSKRKLKLAARARRHQLMFGGIQNAETPEQVETEYEKRSSYVDSPDFKESEMNKFHDQLLDALLHAKKTRLAELSTNNDQEVKESETMGIQDLFSSES